MKPGGGEPLRTTAKRFACIIGAFLLGCFGLAGTWPPIESLARNLGRELGCRGSMARAECIQEKHRDAERRSLQSIEDELRSLK